MANGLWGLCFAFKWTILHLPFFLSTGFKDAFYKYTFDEADVQGFKYDLTSIMHYENTAFTNGYCRPTMLVKKDPSYEVTPVYLRKFSPQDIQKINKLYSCQTNQLPPTGKHIAELDCFVYVEISACIQISVRIQIEFLIRSVLLPPPRRINGYQQKTKQIVREWPAMD